jgi:hypothetical protein
MGVTNVEDEKMTKDAELRELSERLLKCQLSNIASDYPVRTPAWLMEGIINCNNEVRAIAHRLDELSRQA